MNPPLFAGTLLVSLAGYWSLFLIANDLSGNLHGPGDSRSIFSPLGQGLLGATAVGFVLMVYGAFFRQNKIKKRGYSRHWEEGAWATPAGEFGARQA